MTDWILHEGERLDDLVRDGMKIIQRPDQFCFSLDSVLLAHYDTIKKNDRIADLRTATPVLSLLLSSLGGNEIVAFEVNPVMADLARRNVMNNHKTDKIQVVEIDYRKAQELYPSGRFTSVVVNPPYRSVGSGRMSRNEDVASASYEVNATLEEVFHTSRYLLKYGGRLTMVHRADRMADLIALGRKYNMEPKRVRPVYTKSGKVAVRVLMEWKYGGNPELIVENPLFIHNSDGSYTNEILDIYGKESNE